MHRVFLFVLFVVVPFNAWAQRNVPLGETVYFDADTFDPTTHGPANADATPTCKVYEEATDTAIVTNCSIALRAGTTGEYRGNFVASTGNGFELGKWYIAKVYATVGALPGN